MKRLIGIVILIIVSSAIYLLSLRGFDGNPLSDNKITNTARSPGPFESSHERAPYALTYSLVEGGSFELSKELADFASPDTVKKDNSYYIIFPPGMSFLAMPFYSLGKSLNLAQVITFAGMTIFAIFNLLVIYVISNRIFKLPDSLSFFSSLIFGFATTSWSFASSLYQHQVTTFLILTSFLAAWIYRNTKNGYIKSLWLLWIWFCFGFSVWLDYPSVILFAPILVYTTVNSFDLKESKKNFNLKINLTPLITSVLFIVIVVLHGYYNHLNFGRWSSLAQLQPRYDTKIIEENKDTKKLEEIEEAEKSKNVSGVFEEKDFFRGFYILTIAPDKGLFFFSPILFLGVLGVLTSFSKKSHNLPELITFSSIFFVNIFFYSSWGDPWGGWAYGPRYLIPSMSILTIFTGTWIYIYRKKFLTMIITILLLLYSVAIATLGAVTTTITPPKVEADFLGLKYGFFNNWDVFMKGDSGSYLYNNYFSQSVDLIHFYMIIYSIIIIYALALLFSNFLKEKNGN